jgi:hypothetical protein
MPEPMRTDGAKPDLTSAGAELDRATWAAMGFTERVRIGTNLYVREGMHFPLAAYLFHAVKLPLLILGWMFFCRFTPGLGTFADFTWIFADVAFQKAYLWAILFEVMGLGCMSGPLGVRIWPPFTAFLHFLRPGTIKIAPFPRLPVFGGRTRTWLDVALYAALLASLLRALVQPSITTADLLPIVVLLPLCGLGDKTVLLAARVEHHFAMVVCFTFAPSWIAACKWVQCAVWFWAGVSKLTVAFGYVVPLMMANNPLLRSAWVRRRLFVSYPADVSPSRFAKVIAYGGTFLELAAPLTLLFVTDRGPLLWAGMTFVLLLHGFILSNLPVGAIFEWNVLSIYTAFFLFVGHPEISPFDVGPAPVALYLVLALLVLPLVGNLVPSRVSFLVAMRYYAGNWAWNAWLFRDGSDRKLDALKCAAPVMMRQYERFLPPSEIVRAEASGFAFRTLHLQGRALGLLLPTATDGVPFQRYTYMDGETVAASVLGWNFGEGHLCDDRLLDAIQPQCRFEAGELRLICVESQPLLGSSLHWRIIDPERGLVDEGYADLSDLSERKPWDLG